MFLKETSSKKDNFFPLKYATEFPIFPIVDLTRLYNQSDKEKHAATIILIKQKVSTSNQEWKSFRQ
jgi:hypothetical protein